MSKRPATILVYDISNYTALAESNTTDLLYGFIKEFIEITGEVLLKLAEENREIEIDVNQFLGDSFLIFFFGQENVSDIAVEASIRIRDKFNSLRIRYQYELDIRRDVNIRFAISEGEILWEQFACPLLESISKNKLQEIYAGLGNDINLAFRLVNEAKNGLIVITPDVFRGLTQQQKLHFARMEPISLKHLKDPISPYIILGNKSLDKKASCERCQWYVSCKQNWEGRHEKMLCAHPQHPAACYLCWNQGDCLTNIDRGHKNQDRECCELCNNYSICFFNWHLGRDTTKGGERKIMSPCYKFLLTR